MGMMEGLAAGASSAVQTDTQPPAPPQLPVLPVYVPNNTFQTTQPLEHHKEEFKFG